MEPPVVYGEPLNKDEVLLVAMTDNQKLTFITKTYTCVIFQLGLTTLSIFLSKYYQLQNFYISDLGLTISALSISCIFTILMLICCAEKILQYFPYNYLILILFSCSVSYLLSCSLSFVPEEQLLLSSALTLGDVTILTIYSLFWSIDIHLLFNLVILLFLNFTILLLVNLFIYTKLLTVIIAGTGSILFSALLLYDTNLILYDRKVYTPQDFILASINLYLDIMNIFIYTLQCLTFSE
jgi:FtsH-binding integral membrane protein